MHTQPVTTASALLPVTAHVAPTTKARKAKPRKPTTLATCPFCGAIHITETPPVQGTDGVPIWPSARPLWSYAVDKLRDQLRKTGKRVRP